MKEQRHLGRPRSFIKYVMITGVQILLSEDSWSVETQFLADNKKEMLLSIWLFVKSLMYYLFGISDLPLEPTTRE